MVFYFGMSAFLAALAIVSILSMVVSGFVPIGILAFILNLTASGVWFGLGMREVAGG